MKQYGRRVNKNRLISLYIPLLALSTPATPNSPPTIKGMVVLGQGEQRMLRTPGLKRFSVGSDHVRVTTLPPGTPSADRLLIKGVRPGRTDLWIWRKDSQREVVEVRTIQVHQQTTSASSNDNLLAALNALDQVEIISSGSRFLIRGAFDTREESRLIRDLSENFPKRVLDRTYPSEKLRKETLQKLHLWLETTSKSHAFVKDWKVLLRDQNILLSGFLPEPSLQKKFREDLEQVLPHIRTELDALPTPSQITYFRIFLLELKRDQFENLGLNWPGRRDSVLQISPSRIGSQLDFDLHLNLLSANGSARILANPQIVVRSPGKAELFAGGEFPIRTKTRFQSNVSWKTYGLKLLLGVTQKSGEQVRLDFHAEVSHLDYSVQSEDVPGVRLNRIKTEIDAKMGQPLLLCGLLQENIRKTITGLPVLKEIPILGSLFSSQSYLQEESELVTVLVPHHQPPPPSKKTFDDDFPLGPAPPPRNWMDWNQEKKLRSHPQFPWNVLNG